VGFFSVGRLREQHSEADCKAQRLPPAVTHTDGDESYRASSQRWVLRDNTELANGPRSFRILNFALRFERAHRIPSPNSVLAKPATVLSDTEQIPTPRPEGKVPDCDISSIQTPPPILEWAGCGRPRWGHRGTPGPVITDTESNTISTASRSRSVLTSQSDGPGGQPLAIMATLSCSPHWPQLGEVRLCRDASTTSSSKMSRDDCISRPARTLHSSSSGASMRG
jgi:hypothetical protein